MVLRHSPGSVLPTFARPFCRVHYTSVISSCAVHVPLSPRPLSPQQAKSLITRDRLLSSVAARTSTPQVSTSSSSREVVELAILIDVLPARVRAALQPHKALSQLVEVVLDLGRPVVARFTEGAQLLSRDPLTQAELEEVTSKACFYTAESCFMLVLPAQAVVVASWLESSHKLALLSYCVSASRWASLEETTGQESTGACTGLAASATGMDILLA